MTVEVPLTFARQSLIMTISSTILKLFTMVMFLVLVVCNLVNLWVVLFVYGIEIVCISSRSRYLTVVNMSASLAPFVGKCLIR